MKDKIYLVSPNFIKEKIKKIFDMPGEIGFIARFSLLCVLREREIIYIQDKEICSNGYGCNCDSLHKVDCKNRLTIIAIGWIRGNKEAFSNNNYSNPLLGKV
jgi:hypothetical protein